MERRRRSAFCGRWRRFVIPGVTRASLHYLGRLPDAAEVTGNEDRFVGRFGSGYGERHSFDPKNLERRIIQHESPATCTNAQGRTQIIGMAGIIVVHRQFLALMARFFIHARLAGQDGDIAR